MHVDAELIPHPWEPQATISTEHKALEGIVLASTGPEQEDDPHHIEWLKLRNVETGELVWLRLRREIGGEGYEVSGMTALPEASGGKLANQSVRSISFSQVEKALNTSRYAGKFEGIRQAHLTDNDWDVLGPLGNPRDNKDFYARVASQYAELERLAAKNPVSKMMEINARPRKTIQGWITEARRRSYLPPGKPGRSRND